MRPSEGRLLSADDTRLGGDPRIAVIGEELRARLFAPGAPVVGRSIVANGETVTIVGVAGGGFRGPQRGEAIDMWIPHAALTALLGFPEEALTSRNSVMHRNLVVRPRTDIPAAAAEAQLASLMEHVVATVPESAEWLGALRPRLDPGLHLPPLWRASTYGSLRLLAGVVALVLLIACANVANLFLFRNLARRGALATRRALGASSGRLARHQLAESLWLGLLGTVLGLAVAWAIVLPFRGERLLRMLPAFEGFVVDGRVAAFAGALVVITTVLFGVVPAALAGRFDLDGALRDAGGRDTQKGAWLRRMVSAAQVALCLTLLVGGLLLARTIRNLYTVDTGYDLADVSAVYLETRDVPAGSTLHDFGQRLLEAVGTVQGVTGAALDVYPPHGPTLLGRAGLPGTEPREAPRASMWPVTPTWFDVVGVTVERGRALQPADGEPGAPGVTVLTPALARRLFGDADPIGGTVAAGFHGQELLDVVGVTEDLRHARSPDEVLEGFFVPFARADVPTLSVLVRTRSQDAGTLARVREALETVVPDQPVPDPQTLSSLLDDVHAERRLVGRLLALLSALAVGLAAVGLYGAIAFAAAGRTREFGIRLALGARAERIARLVMVDALGIVALGTAGGLLGAWLLGRVLESRLYGVAPVDPASYVAATALFAAVALLACWTPARRATRVDPVHTLKGE